MTNPGPLKMPHSQSPLGKHIVIIGGGASGVITLIRAMEILPSDTHFTIIEPNQFLGMGRAYSTSENHHLLNVPSEKMSLFQNRKSDFSDWLRLQTEMTGEPVGPYAPRKYFYQYIQARLKEVPKHRFTHYSDRAKSFQRVGQHWNILTDAGNTLTANAVIVATGYENQVDTALLHFKGEDGFERVIQPYDTQKLKSIHKNDRTLVIGTGLSAADVFLQLRHQGIREINLISRHGLFPIPHPSLHHAGTLKLPHLEGLSPLQIFRIFRSFYRIKQDELIHLVQEVRQQSTHIWTGWTPEEKKQFIRHLKPYWEIVRHRVPSSVFNEMELSRKEGQLKSSSGRILQTVKNGDGLDVTILQRGKSQAIKMNVNWIIVAADAKINQSLHTTSFTSGPKKCPLGLGYLNEQPKGIWVVGPAAKSSLWESTAIPDITQQIETMLLEVLSDFQANDSSSKFTDHPRKIQETYFQHLVTALKYAFLLSKFSFFLFVHAVFPFIYTDHVGNQLIHLSKALVRRKLRPLKRTPTRSHHNIEIKQAS